MYNHRQRLFSMLETSVKTPAGKECHYYYEDFHRGRNRQECRLLLSAHQAGWRPSDCSHCPVPDILWANASPNLLLDARIDNGFLGIGRHIGVTASCRKHGVVIKDPYVGCEQCAEERPDMADLVERGNP